MPMSRPVPDPGSGRIFGWIRPIFVPDPVDPVSLKDPVKPDPDPEQILV